MGCFCFASTEGRSLALTTVLAVVLECFAEGRMESVAAAVAAVAAALLTDGGGGAG